MFSSPILIAAGLIAAGCQFFSDPKYDSKSDPMFGPKSDSKKKEKVEDLPKLPDRTYSNATYNFGAFEIVDNDGDGRLDLEKDSIYSSRFSVSPYIKDDNKRKLLESMIKKYPGALAYQEKTWAVAKDYFAEHGLSLDSGVPLLAFAYEAKLAQAERQALEGDIQNADMLLKEAGDDVELLGLETFHEAEAEEVLTLGIQRFLKLGGPDYEQVVRYADEKMLNAIVEQADIFASNGAERKEFSELAMKIEDSWNEQYQDSHSQW